MVIFPGQTIFIPKWCGRAWRVSPTTRRRRQSEPTIRKSLFTISLKVTPFIDRYRIIRKMFLDHYARRLKNGKLDPKEVWPELDELPEGVTTMKAYKKGLIDQVLPLCLQNKVSNARKTACQYVAFATRSKPVCLVLIYL